MPQSNNPDNLLTSAHAALDHSGIPGVGISEAQRLFLPRGPAYGRLMPNPGLITAGDSVTSEQYGDVTVPTASIPNPSYETDAHGGHVLVNGIGSGAFELLAHLNMSSYPDALPIYVAKAKFSGGGISLNITETYRFGFGSNGVDIGSVTNGVWVEFGVEPAGIRTVKFRSSATIVDSGYTHVNDTLYYAVVEFLTPTSAKLSVLDSSFNTIATTTLSGAQLPVAGRLRPVYRFNTAGDNGYTHRFYGAVFNSL